MPRPAPAPPEQGGAPRQRHPRRWSEGGTDGGPVYWPRAAAIVESGWWTPDCVRRLIGEMHIPINDMQNLRLCIECALEDLAQLDMDLPAAASAMVLEGLTATAEKAQAPLKVGLWNFYVVPKSPGGLDWATHAVG